MFWSVGRGEEKKENEKCVEKRDEEEKERVCFFEEKKGKGKG